MAPVTTHFDALADKLRAFLPSLRYKALEALGVDPTGIPVARRDAWYSKRLNCYNYAIDHKNADEGWPGALFQHRHTGQKLSDIFRLSAGGPTKFLEFSERIVEGMQCDGLLPLGFEASFPARGTLVAAFTAAKEDIDERWGVDSCGHDMHFYTLRRLDETIHGITKPQLVWAHKRGDLPAEFCRAGIVREGDVSDPAGIFTDARNWGYNYFAGFFLADRKAMDLRPG